MNDQPVKMSPESITGTEFASMLPNATDAFDVTFINGLNYTSFYDAVYEARKDEPAFPYSFGSF